MTPATSGFRVVILMPVYRDWDVAAMLCHALDRQLGRLRGVDARVLLVDDGSPDGIDNWCDVDCRALRGIDVLRLRRNLGHQRAICQGLCHIHANVECDAVVVMDADGEDRPEDVVRLIESVRKGGARVLFAERRKRHEGGVFRVGYALFRLFHRVLTGIAVRVGNFSIVPAPMLSRLVCMPELWNHFAGAVYKSNLHFERIPMDRGKRLGGRSHMDLPALVAHGIAGIATFHEKVAARILITSVVGLCLLIALLIVITVVRLLTSRAIPGWATYTTGFVLVLTIQIVAMAFSLVFTLICNRSAMAFVPCRDYLNFVDRVESLAGPGSE